MTPRDGDGDGFYSPFRGAPDKTPMRRVGKPVIPNPPFGQDVIDQTIAGAEAAAALKAKSYPSQQAAFADLSSTWKRDGEHEIFRGGTTLRIHQNADGTWAWKDSIAKKQHSGVWYATHPNPKSSAKEIVGHHGHKPHGPSIKWPALYEHLRAKGYSKAKAAAISNAAWKKKHLGIATNTPTSARGVLKSLAPDLAFDVATLAILSHPPK